MSVLLECLSLGAHTLRVSFPASSSVTFKFSNGTQLNVISFPGSGSSIVGQIYPNAVWLCFMESLSLYWRAVRKARSPPSGRPLFSDLNHCVLIEISVGRRFPPPSASSLPFAVTPLAHCITADKICGGSGRLGDGRLVRQD